MRTDTHFDAEPRTNTKGLSLEKIEDGLNNFHLCFIKCKPIWQCKQRLWLQYSLYK